MIIIPCPWCGARDESEFTYGGEAHISRPTNPEACSDQEWADYLYTRSNTKGVHSERWYHASGCRRWFNASRETVSDKVLATYKIGAQKPSKAALKLEARPAVQSTDGLLALNSEHVKSDKPKTRRSTKKKTESTSS